MLGTKFVIWIYIGGGFPTPLFCAVGSCFPFHQKVDPSEGCFGVRAGEWRKQLQDFITQSFKPTPLCSGTISSLFWSNGFCRIRVGLVVGEYSKSQCSFWRLRNERDNLRFTCYSLFLCVLLWLQVIKPILGNRYVSCNSLSIVFVCVALTY